MFLEGDFFAQSCANEFAFNMGIMMAAIWHLTGMVVVRIGPACKTRYRKWRRSATGSGGIGQIGADPYEGMQYTDCRDFLNRPSFIRSKL